jgi:hypothetical protein
LPTGYGTLSVNGKHAYAHRLSLALHSGLDIPDGLVVCHRCDNPSCVNPAHLFLGTHQDNLDDMKRKSRSATGDKNGMRTKPEARRAADRPENRARGTRHHCARLDESKVVDIRRQFAAGDSMGAIAAKFKVNSGTIFGVVRRRTWTHI